MSPTPTPAPLPHEWHTVGNIPACKHCKRAEHMLNPRKGDECPARLRTALDTALAAREEEVRREEREACAAIVDGWHIRRGGYTELARVIRERGGRLTAPPTEPK